jgi:AhpD family alkylhydroperoxidase
MNTAAPSAMPSSGSAHHSVLQVYDPAMCCSTGICGPQVDPVLVRFAADVKWLEERGVEVRRFTLSQNPAAFVENELVRAALTEKGESALPFLLIDDKTVANGKYPTREQLAAFCGLADETTGLITPAVAELIAIAAAVASNCDPCLRYHVHQAGQLGVTRHEIEQTVQLAAEIKDATHRNVMRLAARLTHPEVPSEGGCCADDGECDGEAKGGCCS